MKAANPNHSNSRLSNLFYAAFLTILFSFNHLQAQTWSPVGVGGMNDWVYASAEYNGDLIVGGKFSNADGVSASHIARWDGTAWHAMGLGVNGKVNALIVHNGLLYVGGEFTEAGGLPMNFIAIWNGTQWLDDLGDMGNIVTAFAIYNNHLVVGGYFTDADGVPLNYVAMDGSNGWEALGTGTVGTQGQVMAMEIYNNELIVGGFFTSAGGVSAAHVAKWNGTAWSALGSGISNIVYTFTNYNGRLIAGGLFTSAGGVVANHIASWDGTSWSALGTGMSGTFYQYVFALAVYQNKLIAGGYFTHSGGNLTNGIAQWNDTTWNDMGCGLFYPGNVFGTHTLCLYGTDLIVGGLFNSAGCTGAAHLAKYNASTAGCTVPAPLIIVSGTTTFCEGDSVQLTASAASGGGGNVLDQSQTNYNAGTSARTLAGYSHWQSFTAGITGTLSRIDIGFFNAINGAGTLKIFAGTGTGGALLQSQTINVLCASGNCMLPFNVSAPVTAGQVYSFQFIPGAGMPDPYGVQVQNPGTYPSGEMFLVDPSGTYATGFDMVFKTYVSTANQLTYSWSDGSTDSTTIAYHTGTYTVTITDPLGCTAASSEIVTEISVQAAIISDPGTVLSCLVDSIILTASPSSMNYEWNNSLTDSAIFVSSAASYSLTVTEPSSGCSASIITNISELPTPTVNLGNDTTICISCNLLLDAGSQFSAYIWSTGEITSAITVDSAALYFVQITDSNGCRAYDTLIVTKPAVGIDPSGTEENKLSLFHNLSTNSLSVVASPGLQNVRLEIYNMTGAVVYSCTLNGKVNEIDVAFLPSAVYILELQQHSKKHRLKFVRN